MADDDTSAAEEHYNEVASTYDDMYEDEEAYEGYPSQAICRDIAIERIRESGLDVERALDIGCGTGRSTLPLLRDGIDAYGFDFAEKMVETARENLAEEDFDPGRIEQGDINDGIPFEGTFDAVICLGAVPHAEEQRQGLVTIADALNPEGMALVQLRNELFNAYTFNEYTYHFFTEQLLDGVDLGEAASERLDERLRDACDVEGGLDDDFPSDHSGSFTNPLTIDSLFESASIEVADLHFHHYHAMLPEFEGEFREAFNRESFELEDPQDWRGYLMASAFLVEAYKH